MRAIEALHEDDHDEGDDPYDDLHHILEQLLPTSDNTSRRVRQVRDLLSLITVATKAAPDTSGRIARELYLDPISSACVLVAVGDDDRIARRLRNCILIAAAALDPTLAGSFAADLPALWGSDPRDEPALRDQVSGWWSRTVQVLRRNPQLLHEEPSCPEPGAALLRSATANERGLSSVLEDLPTDRAAVAVAQAVSAIGLALADADLPAEVLE